MNNVAIIGRLTKDVELKYTTSQQAYCKITVAADRGKGKNGEDMGADFIPVSVFGKTAENCDKYLAKGRQVGVQGRIRTGKYEDKNGNTVFTTEVIADRVEFIGSKGDSKPKEETETGFTQIDDCEIPF